MLVAYATLTPRDRRRDRVQPLKGRKPRPDDGKARSARRTHEELVQRARALHVAFDQLGVKVDQQVEVSGVLVIGFRMRGRHVGPLATPLGEIPAPGRDVEVRTIDILTAPDDVVTDVFVVADELGRLSQLGAVTLVPTSSE